jgi:hypothetical protein
MTNQPELARRQRQAAHILVLVLREHADLPALTWTITDALHAHIDLCDVDSDRDRRVFTTWVTALNMTHHPEPAGQAMGTVNLHAHRHINGLLVTLTATVHPY